MPATTVEKQPLAVTVGEGVGGAVRVPLRVGEGVDEGDAPALGEGVTEGVRDGEGVHRVVTVRVAGAKSVGDADAAARAIAFLSA
jgi:hypothetical protein